MDITREAYVEILRGLLSHDTKRIRDANRTLYEAVVESRPPGDTTSGHRQADLVLAEVADG